MAEMNRSRLIKMHLFRCWRQMNCITLDYRLNADDNGVYFMVVNGFAEIAGIGLERRDAIGVYDFKNRLKFRLMQIQN